MQGDDPSAALLLRGGHGWVALKLDAPGPEHGRAATQFHEHKRMTGAVDLMRLRLTDGKISPSRVLSNINCKKFYFCYDLPMPIKPICLTFQHPTLPKDAPPDTLRYILDQQKSIDRFVWLATSIVCNCCKDFVGVKK